MNENPADSNAISIYGQEGLDDFPVLKAFQQYIDAEQSKSRKRMIMLCVFFGFLMSVMIVVFLFMLRDASARNQSLNDKLVEYVMKERERQPVVVQPPAPVQNAANDAAIKAMTDTLAALQKQMADQQAKMIEQQAKLEENRAKMAEEQLKAVTAAAAKAQEAAAAQKVGPSMEQLALQKQIDEDTAKLVKARALLKAEKDKIAAEKEKLRREEVERQRRRLYPEYYEKKDAEEKAAAEKPKQSPLDELDAPVSYFDAYDNELDDDELDDLVPSAKPKAKAKPAAAPAKRPAASPAKKPATPSTAAAKPQPKPAAPAKPKAAASDRYVVPVEINGADSDWLIPTT